MNVNTNNQRQGATTWFRVLVCCWACGSCVRVARWNTHTRPAMGGEGGWNPQG